MGFTQRLHNAMWFNHLYSWFAGFLFALKCLHVLHELRSLLKRLLNRST
jgi:hypothetical protein